MSNWSPGSNATEFLVHEDPKWQAGLDSLREDGSAVLEGVSLEDELEADWSERLPLAYPQQAYLDMEVRPPVPQTGDESVLLNSPHTLR